jgi:hypothetical protein
MMRRSVPSPMYMNGAYPAQRVRILTVSQSAATESC